jgi:hypothetical protein
MASLFYCFVTSQCGARTFSEFSKEMIAKFGNKVRPYLERLYRDQLTELGLLDEIDEAGIKAAFLSALAAATPISKLAVETMPSFAPSTAARRHPIRAARCLSRCGPGISLSEVQGMLARNAKQTKRLPSQPKTIGFLRHCGIM